MIFDETKLKGVYVIELDQRQDDRGFFARAWCQDVFEAQGLNCNWVQGNVSHSVHRGTLRGMHYQIAPGQEVKLIRCTRGGIYDVVIDLRCDSPTYQQWFGVELSAGNYRSLYVPEGFAHGFLTLEDDTEIVYQMSEFYRPELEHGLRYNDPAFAVEWPIEVRVLSEKDRTWPDYLRLETGPSEARNDYRR